MAISGCVAGGEAALVQHGGLRESGESAAALSEGRDLRDGDERRGARAGQGGGSELR